MIKDDHDLDVLLLLEEQDDIFDRIKENEDFYNTDVIKKSKYEKTKAKLLKEYENIEDKLKKIN